MLLFILHTHFIFSKPATYVTHDATTVLTAHMQFWVGHAY